MPTPERISALESLQQVAPNIRGSHATIDVINEEYRVEVSDGDTHLVIEVDMEDSELARGMIYTSDGRQISVEYEQLESFAEYMLSLLFD